MDPSCKPILNGAQSRRLRQFEKTRKTRKSSGNKIKVSPDATYTPLFDALRLHRSQLAQQQAVLPYVILHDKPLHAIYEMRPESTAQFADIPGNRSA